MVPERASNASKDRRAEDRDRIWRLVAHAPLRSLWETRGVPLVVIGRRTFKSVLSDRIFSRAAELGFYFLFSLFPTLFCASAIFGMVARSAHQIYDHLLAYLALVIPTSAMGAVINTFNQTTAAATSGKITFSLLGAIWSASVGISAMQEILNEIYKIEDSRSYLVARLYAIGVTVVVSVLGSLSLAALFAGDWTAMLIVHRISNNLLVWFAATAVRVIGWTVATALLLLVFAVIYYWGPDWRERRWRWFTPGGAIGIFGWLIASLGFRIYLHYFNTYAVTYGSLGAVVILLMWFYITGLMLLVGGEINAAIEAAGIEKTLRATPGAADKQPEAA